MAIALAVVEDLLMTISCTVAGNFGWLHEMIYLDSSIAASN